MGTLINQILDVVLSTQFIATFFASGMAFLGVVLTLRRGQKTHEKNLAAENQKSRDHREFEAKKRAFAELSETTTRFIHYVGRLPDHGMVGKEAPNISEDLSAKVNSLLLYADNETIEKGLNVARILTASFVEVLTKRLPVSFLDEDIKLLDSEIIARKSWIENLDGKRGNEALISSLWGEVAEREGKKAEITLKRYRGIEECRDAYIECLPRIYSAQIPLLISLRRELGFVFDEGRFEKVMMTNAEEAKKYANTTIAAIREEIAKKIEPQKEE